MSRRLQDDYGNGDNKRQKKWKVSCVYLNVWPVSWSSPAAGAMRMYGVVSWVTIIAAKAKEEFRVSMHEEEKKSQTEARPTRILQCFTNSATSYYQNTTFSSWQYKTAWRRVKEKSSLWKWFSNSLLINCEKWRHAIYFSFWQRLCLHLFLQWVSLQF